MIPKIVDITAKTGATVKGALTSWQTPNGPYLVEHLAGRAANDDLLVHYWMPGQDWRTVNVTQITGHKIASPLTSWQTPNGPMTVEHLAGQAPNGDLLVFYWMPGQDWRAVNVTQITGHKIAGPLTSWQAPNGPMTVEHLAGPDAGGNLHVFWWSPAHDWQALNISQITGECVAGPVDSWSVGNVEHLAGRAQNGDLLVFYWTPGNNWRVVNVTRLTGEKIAGRPAAYQLPDGPMTVELLSGRSPDGSLLLFWWQPDLDWQVINLSKATGRTIASDPEPWATPSGGGFAEHWAAEAAPDHRLLVFWGDQEPRRLLNELQKPFKEVKRMRGRRQVLATLWDPARPDHPALPRQQIENLFFGAANSVRDYFLQNSGGFFTIDRAGVFGWYPADKPADHYWGPPDTNDTDHDGWVNGHVEKWAEAIRKADAQFNFQAFDRNPFDGQLRPDELGVMVVIPQNGPFGTNRDVVGREYPNPLPLVVDGATVRRISEAYIGNPPNLGLVAHELAHLLLGLPDMYFGFFMSMAAGDYCLMDRTYKTTHLNPFLKLKLGWLRPQMILRDGRYDLLNVESSAAAWVLMHPQRSTKEYFLVENRWRGNSYDNQMASTGGLGVWHIMEDPQVYGSVGPPPGVDAQDWVTIGAADWGRRVIRLLRPVLAPPFDDRLALWDGANPQTGYDLLSNDPNPQHTMLRWADGTPSGFGLRQISPAGATMSAMVETPF